jgi:hypothetical protein
MQNLRTSEIPSAQRRWRAAETQRAQREESKEESGTLVYFSKIAPRAIFLCDLCASALPLR